MNLAKQEVLMSILDTGIYEIDLDNGLIYANRKRGKVLLKTNKLPTGYHQIMLFKGRRTGVQIICYLHQVVYMAKHGLFNPELEIDHEDRNRSNNSITNLVAKTSSQNYANTERQPYPTKLKLIRSPEIAQIRQLLSLGNSQASIAKQLGLGRISVRYIIKRIEAGIPLKYE